MSAKATAVPSRKLALLREFRDGSLRNEAATIDIIIDYKGLFQNAK
jgi:hypothetical protein